MGSCGAHGCMYELAVCMFATLRDLNQSAADNCTAAEGMTGCSSTTWLGPALVPFVDQPHPSAQASSSVLLYF